MNISIFWWITLSKFFDYLFLAIYNVSYPNPHLYDCKIINTKFSLGPATSSRPLWIIVIMWFYGMFPLGWHNMKEFGRKGKCNTITKLENQRFAVELLHCVKTPCRRGGSRSTRKLCCLFSWWFLISQQFCQLRCGS